MKYTPKQQELVDAINRVPKNVLLTKANISEYTNYSYRQYSYHFNGITDLLASLDRPHYKCKAKTHIVGITCLLTNEQLIELGKKATIRLTRANCKSIIGYEGTMVASRFKGWNNYLEKIGQRLNKNPKREALIELGKSFKGPLTVKTTQETLGYCSEVFRKEFGSWNNFMKEIGREPIITKHDITNEELIALGKKHIKEVKTPLTYKTCKKYLGFNPGIIEYRFGWDNYLKLIGQKQRGRWLSYTTVGKDNIKYHSSDEAEFANKFLYKQYTYKTQIQYKKFVETHRMFTCDFWVENIGYIEVYSQTNKNNNTKKQLLDDNNIKCYWIFHSDVHKYETLSDILKNAHEELKE